MDCAEDREEEVKIMPLINRLYLAIIPIVHLTDRFGLTEQVMTLFPDPQFATLFSPDEVNGYVATFERRAQDYLSGGNVERYEFKTEPVAATGMVRVVVTQYVK